jgi:hypothetical protein
VRLRAVPLIKLPYSTSILIRAASRRNRSQVADEADVVLIALSD